VAGVALLEVIPIKVVAEGERVVIGLQLDLQLQQELLLQ
jgi:hypothetical protein